MIKATRNQLTLEERCQMTAYFSLTSSVRAVARALKRNPSVIARELKRNKGSDGYKPERAHNMAKKRLQSARNKPRKLFGETLELVTARLKDQWSPQQISGRLKLDSINISHETIYKAVWLDRARGGDLYKNLRHSGKKYNKRSGKNSGRGLIPGRVDISERNIIVEAKTRKGDWEADTVIGADHQGALVTLVDRYSKLTLMAKVAAPTKKLVTAAIIKLLKPFKDFVHTITFDNGKEFAGHATIAKLLKAKTYFAKPYHSWERGLNEHTNGLIRQFLPKGTNFLTVSHFVVSFVQKKLNARPRTVLSFRTPNEVFYSDMGVASTG